MTCERMHTRYLVTNDDKAEQNGLGVEAGPSFLPLMTRSKNPYGPIQQIHQNLGRDEILHERNNHPESSQGLTKQEATAPEP